MLEFFIILWFFSIFSRFVFFWEIECFGDELLIDGICIYCNFDEIGIELYFINFLLYNNLYNFFLVSILFILNVMYMLF